MTARPPNASLATDLFLYHTGHVDEGELPREAVVANLAKTGQNGKPAQLSACKANTTSAVAHPVKYAHVVRLSRQVTQHHCGRIVTRGMLQGCRLVDGASRRFEIKCILWSWHGVA